MSSRFATEMGAACTRLRNPRSGSPFEGASVLITVARKRPGTLAPEADAPALSDQARPKHTDVAA